MYFVALGLDMFRGAYAEDMFIVFDADRSVIPSQIDCREVIEIPLTARPWLPNPSCVAPAGNLSLFELGVQELF